MVGLQRNLARLRQDSLYIYIYTYVFIHTFMDIGLDLWVFELDSQQVQLFAEGSTATKIIQCTHTYYPSTMAKAAFVIFRC